MKKNSRLIKVKYRVLILSMASLIFLTLICFNILPYDPETKQNQNNISYDTKETTLYPEKIKISSAHEIWNRSFGDGNGDSGNDIAIDLKGNIYIAGDDGEIDQNGDDVVLVKYNSTGHYQWNRTYTGQDNSGQQVVSSVAVDSLDNIYIAGRDNTNDPDHGSDAFLLRYNGSGDKEWEKHWNKWADVGWGLGIDSEDNIYVSGLVWFGGDGSDIDLFLIKYNKTGDFQWERLLGGADIDEGYGLTIDSQDNIYIAGYTESYDLGGNGDVWLVKYNSSGHYQWNKTFGGAYLDKGFNVDVDSNDNVYIAGISNLRGAPDEYDILLVKYNSSGHYEWNKTWGDTGDEGWENDPVGIAVDIYNNIIVCGYTDSFEVLNTKVVLLKYNTSGDLIWETIWGGNGHDDGFCVETDKFGNIYASGGSDSFSDDRNIFLAKFSQIPKSFTLSSKADEPDTNGEFLLNWTLCENAINYSVYTSDEYISEINDSIDCIVEGIYSRTYLISGLDNGSYYYKIVAFNEYGNSSSNCIQIDIQLSPPGIFSLSSTANNPDLDGRFYLNWTSAYEANNYTIYEDNDFIDKIDDTIDKLIVDATNLSYYISNRSPNDYYYKIIAFNNFGNTSSICIHIIVSNGAPGSFSLTVTGLEYYGLWDTNGAIDLNWITSESADNYSIYYSTSSITQIDSNDILIANGISAIKYNINGLNNSLYYFAVVAINEYGQTLSNYVYALVNRPDLQKAKPNFFKISTDAGNPDNNGDFNINWGISKDAINYTLYQSNSFIHENDIASSSIIIKHTTSRTYYMTGLPNGIYYYCVVAFNRNGNRTSACLEVVVDSTNLGSFNLYTSVINPKSFSTFNLYWDASDGAQNYSLYWDYEFITKIDDTTNCIVEGNTNRSINVPGLPSGTYFFIVVAFNQIVNRSSNCLEITVQNIPNVGNGDDDGGGGGGGGNTVPFGSFYLIFLAFGIISTIIILNKKLKFKA